MVKVANTTPESLTHDERFPYSREVSYDTVGTITEADVHAMRNLPDSVGVTGTVAPHVTRHVVRRKDVVGKALEYKVTLPDDEEGSQVFVYLYEPYKTPEDRSKPDVIIRTFSGRRPQNGDWQIQVWNELWDTTDTDRPLAPGYALLEAVAEPLITDIDIELLGEGIESAVSEARKLASPSSANQ